MATRETSGNLCGILVRRGIIDQAALDDLVKEAESTSVRLEKLIVDKKLASPDSITLALSEYLGIAPVSLRNFTPNDHLLEVIPKETLTKRVVMPIARVGKTLTVALSDPFDLMAIDELATISNMNITPVVASETDIMTVISRLSAGASQGLDMEELMRNESDVQVMDDASKEDQNLDEMLEKAEGAPVIRMVNMMLVEALRTGASDIHIEPMEKTIRLRYRIDGALVERPAPPKGLQAAIISRVKIMSDLDIAERRIPQDGRFNIKALGKEVDLRVSILPTVHGEKIVMRTLDKSSLAPSLASLGLDEVSERSMQYAIQQPHGIILVTGPTGSGKTTTLYSILSHVNTESVNIMTLEDPVEYPIPLIRQSSVNEAAKLDFASGIRSLMRQDPDIILVGEIRDHPTAEMALRAAMTGHQVYSTLHTNSAIGAIPRLLDIGILPDILAGNIIGVMAQRLIRVLCRHCKYPYQPDAAERKLLGLHHNEEVTLYRAAGCDICHHQGYAGRQAIMEILKMDSDLDDLVARRASIRDIKHAALEKGFRPLAQDGIRRILQGVSSVGEVMRVVDLSDRS